MLAAAGPWALVLVALGIGAAGCKKSSGLECPAGTVQQGGTCVANGEDQVQHEGIVVPDVGQPEPGPDPLPEAVADAPDDGTSEATPEVLDILPDVAAPEVFPGGVIGMKCKLDADCTGADFEGVCLDWVKGYCSVLGCSTGSPCPDGSVCLAMTSNDAACAASCETDADCRVGDGYACKSVPDPTGTLVHVCYQVKLKGGPGDGCKGPQDCAGAAGCLTNFAGGYCAQLQCDTDASCPADTHCVKLNKTSTCLKACAVADDCAVTGALPRACVQMVSIETGEKVGVCGSGTLGLAIGAACKNDSECASFECHIAFTGVCSGNDPRGCKVDKECPAASICLQSPDATRGYCTVSCQGVCSGMNYCLGGTTQGQGECLPGCTSKGDPKCPTASGLGCVFGAPIGLPNGHYACGLVMPGAFGATCKVVSDCMGGQCLVAAGGSGYCTGGCTFGYCPFPTWCQATGGQSRCLLLCSDDGDCPDGESCTTPPDATAKVCYPM